MAIPGRHVLPWLARRIRRIPRAFAGQVLAPDDPKDTKNMDGRSITRMSRSGKCSGQTLYKLRSAFGPDPSLVGKTVAQLATRETDPATRFVQLRRLALRSLQG